MCRKPVNASRLKRVVGAWGAVFVALALAFIADYTVLPLLDHRYRAAFFPGDKLAATLTQKFHAATGGKKLRYVIGSMWLGGNIAHYSPDQPHVLIDGLPRRAPWIDLNNLHAKGAVVVWEVGDLQHLPAQFAVVAPVGTSRHAVYPARPPLRQHDRTCRLGDPDAAVN